MKRIATFAAFLLGCGGATAGEPGSDAAAQPEIFCGTSDTTHIGPLDDLVGCTTFRGSVHISDTGDERVPFPASLRVIEGRLSLFRNSNLVDLGGLENLARIGGLKLSVHDRLADVTALARVRITGEIFIDGNAALTTLNGIHAPRDLALLLVAGNGALTSIDSLSALEVVSGDVTIRDNGALPQSAVEAFVARLTVGGRVEVERNKPR